MKIFKRDIKDNITSNDTKKIRLMSKEIKITI